MRKIEAIQIQRPGLTLGGINEAEAAQIRADLARATATTGPLVAEVAALSSRNTALTNQVATLAGTAANTWYVNTVNGDDAGTGTTAASAKRTLMAALIAAKASGQTDTTIAIHAPEDRPIDGTQPLNISRVDITTRLVSQTGRRWNITGAQRHTGGWMAMGGGVYRKAMTLAANNTPHALVRTMMAADGQPLRVWTKAATASAPAVGEYGYDGTYYYINLPNGQSPNNHVVEVASVFTLMNINSNTTFYGHDMNAWGAQGSVVAINGVGSVAPAFCAFEDSVTSFGTNGWAISGDHKGMRLVRCKGLLTNNDGFNIHGSAGNIALTELVDCEGAYNEDEGVSPHEDTRLNLYRGVFHHNGHGGLTSVGNARVQLYATEFYANRQTDPDVTGWDSGGVAILEQSRLTSVDLYSHDHPGPGVEIDTAGGAIWTDHGGTRSGTEHGNGAPDAV